jgi:transposase-like protein
MATTGETYWPPPVNPRWPLTAGTLHELDEPQQRALAEADPRRLAQSKPPVVIDEWQRVADSWDVVRRAVDADRTPGRFLLTGSGGEVGAISIGISCDMPLWARGSPAVAAAANGGSAPATRKDCGATPEHRRGEGEGDDGHSRR